MWYKPALLPPIVLTCACSSLHVRYMCNSISTKRVHIFWHIIRVIIGRSGVGISGVLTDRISTSRRGSMVSIRGRDTYSTVVYYYIILYYTI